MRKFILQPIAMRIPQSSYMPVLEWSKLDLRKVVSETEFLQRYASSRRIVNVDGRMVAAYGYGLDCWYVLDGEL